MTDDYYSTKHLFKRWFYGKTGREVTVSEDMVQDCVKVCYRTCPTADSPSRVYKTAVLHRDLTPMSDGFSALLANLAEGIRAVEATHTMRDGGRVTQDDAIALQFTRRSKSFARYIHDPLWGL